MDKSAAKPNQGRQALLNGTIARRRLVTILWAALSYCLAACSSTPVDTAAATAIIAEAYVDESRPAVSRTLAPSATSMTRRLPSLSETDPLTATSTARLKASSTATAVAPGTTTATTTMTARATVVATQPSPYSRGPFLVGRSVEGRAIESYRFSHGPQTVILVGGIHGGYEWNTILLAYQTIDYFRANPARLPPAVTLNIIPNANPDGLHAVSEREGHFTATDIVADSLPGRFNARAVDLNRNWDCQWRPTAYWRDRTISGGSAPFSEPETKALRDYFLRHDPAVVVFLHSAAEGVFAAGCSQTGPRSLALASVYGLASGYPVYPHFDLYPITGDAGDWLTTQDIPSFSVELTTHDELEWDRNRNGLLALLAHIQDQPQTAPRGQRPAGE